LLDSTFEYKKEVEDMNNTETMYFVYDVSLEDSSYLVQQFRKQNYLKLPRPDTYLDALAKYLNNTDQGYYKKVLVANNSLERFLIYNQTKKKFIVFQLGDNLRIY
jgi:hypothetical protein